MRYTYPSKTVRCEICGQECKARGLQSHMRLKHQVLTKVIEKIVTISDNLKPHLGDPYYSDAHKSYSNTGDISAQIEVSDTSEISNSHTSNSEILQLNELSEQEVWLNFSGYKDYFLKHPGVAKKCWAKLIETRFRAGNISSTTDRKAWALDSLSYGDSPLYEEFKKIQKGVMNECMVAAENSYFTMEEIL